MRRLSRTQLRSWARTTAAKQGGVDPISLQPLDLDVPRGVCVDHDHKTGQLRGVLNRATNSAEGKVAHAVARWGGTGHDYSKIIPWLRRMCDYLEREQYDLLYPDFKTPEEVKKAALAKRRKTRAAGTAKRQVRSMAPKKTTGESE